MSQEKTTSHFTPTEVRPGNRGTRLVDVDDVRGALVGAAGGVPGEPRWWRDVRRRRLLALADCCAVGFGLAVVLPPERAIWFVAFLPVWVLVAKLAGLYDADHRAMRHLTVDEAPAICAWGVVGTVAVSLLGDLTPAGALDTKDLALVILTAVAADFALRVTARAIWRATTPPERVLIVGSGSLAHSMRRKIMLFSDLHMKAIENGHGGVGIDRVVLAHERVDAVQIAAIADLCNQHEAKLSLVSPLRGQATPHGDLPTRRVADLRVLHLRRLALDDDAEASPRPDRRHSRWRFSPRPSSR